jgi:cupin fold WbuC family metalloprotein
MKIIDDSLLDDVCAKARNSERLRMNYNFHESLDAPAQRLLNALEPGTVLPIHRHWHSAETYVLLRGSIEVDFYNDKGEITESAVLDKNQGKFGVNIPIGQWHTLKVLEKDSVIFEVKDGPYTPIEPKDILTV